MSEAPQMSREEMLQRRVDTMEWHPDVMTEKERLAVKREDAAMAFERDAPPQPRERVARFRYGTIERSTDQRTTGERLYHAQLQQFQGRDSRHARGLRS